MIEPTNKQRAARALKALIYYGSLTGEANVQANLTDFLTDIRHLAKQRGFEIDFKDCVAMSLTHFTAEQRT